VPPDLLILAGMARILPLVLILCAACHSPAPQVITATIPAPTPAPSAPPAAQAPGLTVVGTAQLDVQPDTAELHVTLSATAARPGEAVKVVRARQAQLDAKLAPIGLAPGDIRLSQMTVNPVWDYSANRLRGYEAAIQVSAQTRDFDALAPLMDAAADAGATNLRTEFRADLTAIKKKVRDMAMAAAQEKANQLAQGLGVTLGKITAVSETTDGAWMPNMYVNALETQRGSGGGATTPELQPAVLSISVTYALDG